MSETLYRINHDAPLNEMAVDGADARYLVEVGVLVPVEPDYEAAADAWQEALRDHQLFAVCVRRMVDAALREVTDE